MEDDYLNLNDDTRSILNDHYAGESVIDSTNLFGEDDDSFFDDEYNRR